MFFLIRLFRLSIQNFGFRRIPLFLVGLMLTSSVSGQDLDDRISSANARGLDAAIAAFEDGKLDDSIQLLEGIVNDSSATSMVKKKALCYLGACFTAKKLTESALWAFSELVRMEPCFTIDSNKFPPPVLKAFYEARKENVENYESHCIDPGIQTMAVVDFKNRTYPPNPDYDPLEYLIMELLGPSLVISDSLKIVERDQIDWVLSEQQFQNQHETENAVRTGRLLAVHVVLLGSFSVLKDGDLLLTTRLVKVETGEQLFSTKHRGAFNDFERHIEELSKKIATALNLKKIYKPKANVFNSVEAGLAFAEGLIDMDKGLYRQANKKFEHALQLAPKFIEVQRQQDRIAPYLNYIAGTTSVKN